MKTFISAVALATILSTPAMAEKVQLDPKTKCEVKVTQCVIHDDIALQVAIYHIDRMIMELQDMRAELLREFPKPKDDEKQDQNNESEK